MTTAPPRIDAVFDLDALLTDEEREWQQRARRFAQERILPVIEDDFEAEHFRRELVTELGEAGFLGMHLQGYGCAGAGAVAYGLVCLELEAADSRLAHLRVGAGLARDERDPQVRLRGAEAAVAAGHGARASLIGCFALTEPQGGSDPAGDDDDRPSRRRRAG